MGLGDVYKRQVDGRTRKTKTKTHLCSPSIRHSSSRPPRHVDDTREGFGGGWSCHSAFSSRPPRHTGGTRQVLTGGLPYYSVCVPSNTFLRVFPGFIAGPFRGVGVGFEEPHLRFMVSLGEPGFRRISHISAYAAHQGRLVVCTALESRVLPQK